MCSRGELVISWNSKVKLRYRRAAEKLGEGNFGTVFKASDNVSGSIVARKTVSKAQEGPELPRFEAKVMLLLDHPCLVRLFEVVEEKQNVHFILELCKGGSLLNKILELHSDPIAESIAAPFLRQLFSAVHFMHERNLSHNDLNAKNVLLKHCGNIEGNTAQLADFGSASIFDPGDGVQRGDLFSLGLLMRGMLCSPASLAKPTPKKCSADIMQLSAWEHTSSAARCLCGRLLRRDAAARWSALEALGHPWTSTMRQGVITIPDDLLSKLRAYASCSCLQKVILQAVADQLHGGQFEPSPRELFMALDSDGDGLLTAEDLARSLEQGASEGKKIALPSAQELSEILEGIDPDGLAAIEASTFAGAMLCPPKHNKHLPLPEPIPLSAMNTRYTVNEGMVRAALAAFDRDGNGKLTHKELQGVLKISSGKAARDYVTSQKTVHSGVVCFDDIVRMMQVLTDSDDAKAADRNDDAMSCTKGSYLAKSRALQPKELRTVETDDPLSNSASEFGGSYTSERSSGQGKRRGPAANARQIAGSWSSEASTLSSASSKSSHASPGKSRKRSVDASPCPRMTSIPSAMESAAESVESESSQSSAIRTIHHGTYACNDEEHKVTIPLSRPPQLRAARERNSFKSSRMLAKDGEATLVSVPGSADENAFGGSSPGASQHLSSPVYSSCGWARCV